ncbi:ionotropic receptor 21a [Adelges cooleyi]|uniref:ionotropic receptor 21a n=1 Tax=Adelges cooleyi TaxID=133065 RepID=UPI00217F422D|nr:ionotropic receptor 21a [Adelges cooleyi]
MLLSIETVSYDLFHISEYSSKIMSMAEPGCRNHMIFCQDPDVTVVKFGHAVESKVFVVTTASSWQIREFLGGRIAQKVLNLLVAATGQALQESNTNKVADIKLYTHDVYVDGLGSSVQKILTTWKENRLTRPEVNLYPAKLVHGFQGHRFVVSAIDKPPLVFRSSHIKKDETYNKKSASWDGVEIRLLRLISQILNFTLDIHDASTTKNRDEAEDRIIGDLIDSKADLGVAGLYITSDRYPNVDFSPVIAQDCGAFLSLGSYALSKYRAIFGPFHWSIWVMVVFTYVAAIFPIAFTNNRSVKTLCKSPKQLESMCCYMFGTYTNLFTFKGIKSWTNTKTGSTRLFIGTYWIFTIIITTAYTSSIIAFITLPAQPMTVDTSYELVDENYKIITLEKGGWQNYFSVTNDVVSQKLFKNVKLVNNTEDAMDYIVKTRFILDYAFFGSKISLTYLSQSSYVQKYNNRKIFFHVGSECYVPFNVGLAYKKNFVFRNVLSDFILRAQQSGLLYKIVRDIDWEIIQGSESKQTLLYKVKPEDRQLTLDDVQGMFVLLGGGIFLAVGILLAENVQRWWIKRKKAQIVYPENVFKKKRSQSLFPTIGINITPPVDLFRPLSTNN